MSNPILKVQSFRCCIKSFDVLISFRERGKFEIECHAINSIWHWKDLGLLSILKKIPHPIFFLTKCVLAWALIKIKNRWFRNFLLNKACCGCRRIAGALIKASLLLRKLYVPCCCSVCWWASQSLLLSPQKHCLS